MSHQFGQVFFLVGLLFAPSFPCGKYGADYPLNGVKVAQCAKRIRFSAYGLFGFKFFCGE